jgi:hypothetical protein
LLNKITKKTAPRRSAVGEAINWMLSGFPSSNPAPESQNVIEEQDDGDERFTNGDDVLNGVGDAVNTYEERTNEVEQPRTDTSARSLNHSVGISPRKRKRSDVHATDNIPRTHSLGIVSNRDPTPTEPQPKRPSRRQRAKTPILGPSTSLKAVSNSGHATRSKSTKPVVEIETESSAIPQNLTTKGKGRPKKAHTLELERQQGVRNLSAPGNDDAQSDNSEEHLQENDSISPILDNPSPIKVPKKPSTSREHLLARAERAKRAHRLEALSADEDERSQDEDDSQDLQRDDDQDVARPEFFPFSLTTTQIEELIEISDRVGQKYDKLSKSYKKIISVSEKKFDDEAGKILSALVDSLSTAYRNLHAYILEGRRNRVNNAYANISSRLEDLRTSTRNVVLSIRSTGIEGNATASKNLLVFLYFIILPQWMRCIQLATKACSEEGQMILESSEQIYSLMRLWCSVAGVATAQKVKLNADDVTPFSDEIGYSNFQIKQPTIEGLTKLRKLCRTHRDEIDAIQKRAKDLVSASQEAIRIETEERARESLRQAHLEAKQKSGIEQEEKRASLMRKENQETLARRRLIHRQQRQDVDRIKRELLRNYGLSDRDDRLDGSEGASGRNAESDESDLEEENDPLSDRYKVRIGGFPPDNKRETTRTPWNNEKKGKFALMMMEEAAGM